MITGLKGLGRISRRGKAARDLWRAGLLALAFVLPANAGFAFPHNHERAYSSPRSGFAFAPRQQTFLSDPGFGVWREQRPAFYAYGRAYGRSQRQASSGGARPQGGGPPRNSEARPPYEGGNQRAPHLGAWLQRHGNMPFTDQEKALQNEPGFNRLPPQTQRQLTDRLRQLDGMPPEQRQRTLDRIEALERLSPQMRQQVRAAGEQMKSLPPGRQRMLKKAFRDLRQYPPQERETMMAAPRFQAQFTPQERSILTNLLAVEPYEPNAGFRPEYSPPPGR